MRKIFFSFVALLFSFSSLSCGYSLRSAMPANFRTIHVQPFKNNVKYTVEDGRNLYLPLLEVKVRDAVVSRYLFDGNLRIAESDDADLILRGELTGYEKGGLRFSDNDDVQEYRIHIFVTIELYDTQKKEVVWKEEGFAGEATYFVSGPKAKSETSAVDDAVTDLARRVVERTIENW